MTPSSAAKDKFPAFQLYPNDFLGDQKVVLMSNQQLGIYFRLLCHCWTEKSLPCDLESLSKLANEPLKSFKKIWPRIRKCFQKHKGRLVHKRLQKELKKQQNYIKKQSRNAKQQWSDNKAKVHITDEAKPYGKPSSSHMPKNGLHISSSSSSSPSGIKTEYIHTGGSPKTDLTAQQREVHERLKTPPLDRVVDPETLSVRLSSVFEPVVILEALTEIVTHCARNPEWEKSRTNWNAQIVNWLITKTGADKKKADVKALLVGTFK